MNYHVCDCQSAIIEAFSQRTTGFFESAFANETQFAGMHLSFSQTRPGAGRLLRYTHLRRQGVAQAVDFVFQLAEKRQTALVRPRDFADDPAVRNT